MGRYAAPVRSRGLLFAALAGCTPGANVKQQEEDSSVLQTRSVERWNLLITHKAEKAWDYLTPGYRETKPRDIYAKEMNDRAVRWTKVSFSSQECDANVCKVRLTVDYNVNLGGLSGKVQSIAPVTETWVNVKGHWYFLPEQFQPTKLKDS